MFYGEAPHELTCYGFNYVNELIIRSLQQRATSREEEELREWRRVTPGNERCYREVEAVWRATAVVSDGGAEPRPRAAEIVSEAETASRRRKPIASRLRQVAAVAAALVIGLLVSEIRPGLQVEPTLLRAAEFVTGPNELATAKLSDGTVVRLAPSTRLRVEEKADRREVWLDGKAFFAVTSNERAPFTVRTRAGEALVLGTRFEVDVNSTGLRVVVVEGKVEVGAADHRVEVGAGEVTRAFRGRPPEVSRPEDIRPLLDWMGSFLAFENTPLRQVALEIEDRYGMRVTIADSVLAQRTVTAWFGDENPEAVLRVICRITDTHCSIRDGVASIEP